MFKPPEGTDQKAAEPKEEVNFERANMILSSINMYTDKLTRMRSTLEIQNSGKEIWNFYNTRYLANENEKTKEYIKTEYDKVIERYEKELEKVFKDELKAIMTDVYTDFIHEVVLQKMLRIEPPPGNDDDSGYEIIGPDQLLDKIVANIDNLWITLLTPVPKEDSANFIKLTPGIVAQYMMPEEDETEGNSADAVQKMSAEELKLEEFLACINGVMKKARALKVLKVKKTVIYDSFIARCFNGKKKDFDLSVFETAESIIAETFDPPEGLEPFYTYFMLMYISSALNELKRQMPENEPETELITKTFWDVVSLIHKRQNYHGNFKYFHIIKPQGLRGMTSKDFTDKVNKDFETFLDLKFNHTVIPFDYGEMSSMIYPTNDHLTYNRASGFTLLIDDCLCMVELCSSFYLKADKLDYPGLMSLFSEVKVPVIDVEYFNTNDNKYFSIVLPIKDIFDLFVRQKDTFIPPPSMIASDTEAENVNKAIKTLTESVTNTRGIYLDANINSLDSVAAVNTLNECWDPEFWKRYYTRTHMGDEEYHRRLRVLAAAFGNITLSKGFYNVIQRKNPSDLSLFAAQEGMAKVDFPPNFRFADGYIICGNAAGPARLDDMRVIDKDAEGTSPLDALIKSGANPAETAYVLLVSSKERFGQEWKRGGWGGDSGDEIELFYRTTLQGFLHKKFDENTMCDELFYEPNNTVYFSNVSVYRAGINEGFAMYNTQFKFNLVVALKPDAPDNYRAAWTNVLSTAARFGAKNIVVGGGNTNSELVKEIIKSK